MKILVHTHQGSKKRWVKAIPTSHPQFFITPTAYVDLKSPGFKKGRYSLTHKRTGLWVTHNCRSTRILRKIAAALGGLPIRWGTLTKTSSTDVLRKQPPSVQQWIRDIRDFQLTAKEHGVKVTRKSRKSLTPAGQRKAGKR